MKAILMLEDGKSFIGESLCAGVERIGEVIFNTAVVGYQEKFTDPANANKILVLTYPLIGNYGCAEKFNESGNVWLAGLVMKEKTRIYSNWQAKESLDSFIKKHNLLTIYGIDTRTLTVYLRDHAALLGIISTSGFDEKRLLNKIKEFRKAGAPSLLPKISVDKITRLKNSKTKKNIAVLDLGVTRSIIRQLETLGFSLTLLPYNTPSKDILALKLHGLIISGGPEEDPGLKEVCRNLKPLIKKIPMLGISTGHQLLARALGAKINKLKIGHRGVNYPICNPNSFKGEITVQNHALAVDAASLKKIKDIKITAYNLNDRTVEEMESKKLKILGVQYIPVSPGFNEVNSALKKFANMLKE